MQDKVNQINEVLKRYFELNKSVNIIPVKDLMSYFVKAGVFSKDEKGGLPIRNVLRTLDRNRQLHLIPFVHAERKTKNTSWFFKSSVYTVSKTFASVATKAITAEKKSSSFRKDSDERYVVDLCDIALGHVASRQHRFSFLLGDANIKGTRATLPVDAYYSDLKLVIEYQEAQHSEATKHFDKPDIMTVSGVHRGEQRKIYDKRKLEVLRSHGIRVVQIPYALFDCTPRKRINRSRVNDLIKIRKLLIDYHVENLNLVSKKV